MRYDATVRFLLLLLVACNSSPKDCKSIMTEPLSQTPAHAFIDRCGARFAPRCAAALAGSPAHPSEAEGDAVAAACAEAYPTVARSLDRATWFATALASERDLDEETRRGIGDGIARELSPAALVVHLEADAIEVDGVGSWPVSAGAAIVAALRAHGATRGGLLIWGSREAPATQAALLAMLRGTSIPTVLCSTQNCR